MMKKYSLFLASLVLTHHSFGQSRPLTLWYDKPASNWEETLPLGNGRLGMMPNSDVSKEKIVLNDITLWSGAPQDANNYEAYKKLPAIRLLLLEGKNDEAQALIDQSFICTGKGSGDVPFGCYQTLGDLELQFDYGDDRFSFDHYKRELSLNNAVAGCTYQVKGVTYKREYFTSFGDDIDIIRLTADQPGKLNVRVSVSRPERSITTTKGNELEMSGRLDNGIDGKGMSYLARVHAQLKGGELKTVDNALVIRNATEVILYVAAGTDWKKGAYKEKIQQVLATAVKKTYESQKQQHITNYRKLFDRVTLDLGVASAGTSTGDQAGAGRPPDDIPTDVRINNFHQSQGADNYLPGLFFQFGRYLTISSTRVGLLPPNLQGLWANQIHTPWNGDYHLDINVQMNHWPVEVTNLPELDLPLAELVKGMVSHGERTAKAYYNAEGWVAHVITNPWGFTEPGESASWGVTKVGSGWLCNNLWEHYAFTNDTAYLRAVYPVLKGAALFYNSMLIEEPKTGWLMTAPSSSPENTFYLPNGKTASICMGPTIDNQIIRELFGNVITASQLLGTDGSLRQRLSKRLEKLPPPGQVAKDGRLMEWMEDYKETDVHHRHVSHLYGLFPASLITPESTPDLAAACRATLEARGDDGPSWSIAYKLLWWARLHDGNRAYKLILQLMNPTLATNINYGAGGGIYPNLLSAGPPFQIDGNFGTTAGIAEMLLQSHAGFIDLLPALPDAWKASGEVKGLKARGNFMVDMKWKDGKIINYRIYSVQPRKVKVKVNGEIKEIMATHSY
ncbi:MAG TPA: glycoside hydrolase family 95 protein [Puia sp.]|nr:glycoside hydrolase family 95 protein [Puia sp.]